MCLRQYFFVELCCLEPLHLPYFINKWMDRVRNVIVFVSIFKFYDTIHIVLCQINRSVTSCTFNCFWIPKKVWHLYLYPCLRKVVLISYIYVHWFLFVWIEVLNVIVSLCLSSFACRFWSKCDYLCKKSGQKLHAQFLDSFFPICTSVFWSTVVIPSSNG